MAKVCEAKMRQSSKISFAQMNAANRWGAVTVARGITLMEVLIAIFVLAVGLMGVAALLPVGKSQVQKGTVQQRAATLATKAFESLKTRGILKPSNWMYS
ncbi:MAG: prepilin-type N-terminal cleavage/methylation domain-containing protein, partial [Planctomycetota bacterium]|nr:prepilin-type N-terminal cleavage/methylation domain-containing protein [Planctomycetota bacterium]